MTDYLKPIDYSKIAPTVKLPKQSKPTRAEQMQQQDTEYNAFADQVVSDLQNLFSTNQKYQQSSLSGKEAQLDYYKNNAFNTWLNNDPRFISNPDLQNLVRSKSEAFFKDEITRLKQDKTVGNYAKSLATSLFGKGVDTLADMTQTTWNELNSSARNITTNFREQLVNDNEDSSFNAQLAELVNERDNAEDDETKAVIDERINVLTETHKLRKQNLANDAAQRREFDADKEVEAAKKLSESIKKSAQNERARMADNPVYGNLRQRTAEVQRISGPDAVGFAGQNPLFVASDWILSNAPQVAASLTAAYVGDVVGGPAGARTMLALTGAFQQMGGVGLQIFNDIIETDDETLAKSTDYQEIYNGLEGKYKDDAERRDVAKTLLAFNAAKESAPGAVALGAILEQFGPAAVIKKVGIPKRLEGAGILKRTGRGAVAGTGESAEEVTEGAEVVYAENKALDQDRSLLEGAGQNALQGFVAGGPFGSIGGGKTSVSDNAETSATTTETETPQSTTKTTVAKGPKADDSIRAQSMDTDNPYYDPQSTMQALNELNDQGVMQGINDVALRMVETKNRTARGEIPQYDENDLIQLGNYYTRLQQSRDGDRLVQQSLDNFNKVLGLNWTLEDIQNKAADAVARQAQTTTAVSQPTGTTVQQATVPNAQQILNTTQGGLNGINQGTNTGVGNANSQATANRQTVGTAAIQQNPSGNIGSSATAQSTGVSGAARQDAGTSAQAVFPNQPTSWYAGQGTYSGRDNTVNGTTSSQSDLGSGSPIGTAEQRTGNRSGQTAIGTDQQSTGSSVAPQSVGNITDTRANPATRDYIEQQLENATSFDEINATIDRLNDDPALFAGDISAPARQAEQNISDNLRNDITHTYRSVEYQLEQERIRDMLTRRLQGASEESINAATQLYMRMSLTLSNILNEKILNILPISDIVVKQVTLNSNGVVEGNYDSAKRIITLFVSNPTDLNSTAFAHELTHAFIDRSLDFIPQIQEQSRLGNKDATKFLEDFQAFAQSCGITQGQEFSKAAWANNGNQAHEKAAIAMEHYLVREAQPLPPELNEFANSTFVAKLREYFDRAMAAMHTYLYSVAQTFRGTKIGWNVSFTKLFDHIAKLRRLQNNRKNVDISLHTDSQGRPYLTWGKQFSQDMYYDEQLSKYAQPNFQFYHYGLPNEIKSFFDNVAQGYEQHINNPSYDMPAYSYLNRPDDLISAGVKADNDKLELNFTFSAMYRGEPPFDAVRKGAERARRIVEMRLKNVDPEIYVYDIRENRINDTYTGVSGSFQQAVDDDAASDYTSIELTSNQDLYDLSVGDIAPEFLATVDSPANANDTTTNIQHSDNVDGMASETEENAVINDNIDAINKELTDTATETQDTIKPIDAGFVSYFGGMQNIETDETGAPRVMYVNDNKISSVPTGAEMETSAYYAKGHVVESVDAFNVLDKAENASSASNYYNAKEVYSKAKAQLVSMWNRMSSAVQKSQTFTFTTQDFFALNMLGSDFNIWADSFKFKDTAGNDVYITTNVARVSSIFETNTQDNVFELRSTKSAPTTQQQTVADIASVIKEIDDRHSRDAQQGRQTQTLDQADTKRVAMTGPQRANWWMRKATVIRSEFVDQYAAFRTWCIENFAPVVGAVDHIPFYMQKVMSRNRVRGAKNELVEKTFRPMTQWIASVANELGIDATALAVKMGQMYTDMHIIESAKRQEELLIKQLRSAQLIIGDDRQKAIDEAQAELDAYYQRQSGVENGYGIYGGKTVKDARADMDAIVNGYTTEDGKFIEGLGDDLAQQVVGRFQRAYGDLISILIQRGVLSEKDVMGFGHYAFYCPLVTTTEYNSKIVNDVISLFPSKLNYHRSGSVSEAVDAFTALEYMVNRSANALGSIDLGREAVASWQHLRDVYTENAAGSEVPPETAGGVTRKVFKIGHVTGEYYNGLTAVPMREIERLANAEDESVRKQAQQFIDNGDLVVRVQQRVDDGNGNMVYESVPYIISFDTSDEYSEVKEALAAPFRLELSKPNSDFLSAFNKGMGKATAAFAQGWTTYRPFFPPINSWRDLVEREVGVTGRTYRDANGNPVQGTVIARRMISNLKNVPEIMKAIATGKPEDITGLIGERLSEFKRQGIMSSASLRGLIKHASENTLVYVQKAIADLEKGASLKDTMKKMSSAGAAPFRVWAEMCYAIPAFTMYNALRESGISENDAAFYTTELMNLGQRGKITSKLANYFPFLASIGQTAAQYFNTLGVNITTFGNNRNIFKDKELRSNVIRAHSLLLAAGGMTKMAIPIIASILGDGDDDKGYKILDDFDLNSLNFIPVPIGPGEYGKLQLGFGPLTFAVKMAFGLDRLSRDADTVGNVAVQLMDSFYRDVSPLAGPQWDAHSAKEYLMKMVQTVTPSVFAPMTNVAIGRDYFGRKLVRDNIGAGERLSDISKDGTEIMYKDAAKSIYNAIGWDWAPEELKALATSYAVGPLNTLLKFITDDPLVKDPQFSPVADTMGPELSALGASMAYGTVGNTEQHLYYNYKETYDRYIEASGLAKVMKINTTEKNAGIRANEKRARILRMAGVDSRIISDYTRLHTLETKLSAISKKYHKLIQDARKSNMPLNGIQSLYDEMRRLRTYEISNALPMINLYNGSLKRAEIELPDRVLLDAIREGR